MTQKYTSANTSINTVNAVYKKVEFLPNTLILDYGGGKYDSNVKYMAERGVKVLVYDPFNRSPMHNSNVLNSIKYTKPTFIVCSNVLNVIAEKSEIEKVCEHISKLGGKNTDSIFAIYEGDGTNVGRATTKGYQRNQKTIQYLPMIKKYFNHVIRNGTFIFANNA